MPELPEIETIRAGLRPYLEPCRIQSVSVHRTDLRYPVPTELTTVLSGQSLKQITRRGKYLLFHLHNNNRLHNGLLWHLGMSGSLRLDTKDKPLKLHDHIEIEIQDYYLRYNDPRRFGFVKWVDDFDREPLLACLGPEPLTRFFCGSYLYDQLQTKRVAIKQVIMNPKIVVGVGNIYANEALFEARIDPRLPAHQLTSEQCLTLVDAIKTVLQKAITAGGTTIKDFLQPTGKPGYFKQQLHVYGRKGLPCAHCHHTIMDCVINQRRTFMCPTCQSSTEVMT